MNANPLKWQLGGGNLSAHGPKEFTYYEIRNSYQHGGFCLYLYRGEIPTFVKNFPTIPRAMSFAQRDANQRVWNIPPSQD